MPRRKIDKRKWCAWCGEDMPSSSKDKYCKDNACTEDRAHKVTSDQCIACGNKKNWGYGVCNACYRKRLAAQVGENRRVIFHMARAGYNNKQIASEVGLSIHRVKFYRAQLKQPSGRKAWRPEQETYWKAKTIEAGSPMAVWHKSGLTYAAFKSRLNRIGYRTREAHTG
jgi:hypothetical protein